jgi:hypothetical protein
MKSMQRGLGTFGTLVVLILAAAGGYWVYKNVVEPETVSPPSCKQQLSSCIAGCRKSSTEAPQVQACQEECERKAAGCDENKK